MYFLNTYYRDLYAYFSVDLSSCIFIYYLTKIKFMINLILNFILKRLLKNVFSAKKMFLIVILALSITLLKTFHVGEWVLNLFSVQVTPYLELFIDCVCVIGFKVHFKTLLENIFTELEFFLSNQLTKITEDGPSGSNMPDSKLKEGVGSSNTTTTEYSANKEENDEKSLSKKNSMELLSEIDKLRAKLDEMEDNNSEEYQKAKKEFEEYNFEYAKRLQDKEYGYNYDSDNSYKYESEAEDSQEETAEYSETSPTAARRLQDEYMEREIKKFNEKAEGMSREDLECEKVEAEYKREVYMEFKTSGSKAEVYIIDEKLRTINHLLKDQENKESDQTKSKSKK